MKSPVILVAILAACLAGCATTSLTWLTCAPQVRKMSDAGNILFHDVMRGTGGVGFADQVYFPNAKIRTVTSIQVVVPYNNRDIGVERWTVNHGGQNYCSYLVRFIPDGKGGTSFVVQKDNETLMPNNSSEATPGQRPIADPNLSSGAPHL